MCSENIAVLRSRFDVRRAGLDVRRARFGLRRSISDAVELPQLGELQEHVIRVEKIAHHPGGAAIVAVDKQQRVCMLYQFRHAAGGWI